MDVWPMLELVVFIQVEKPIQVKSDLLFAFSFLDIKASFQFTDFPHSLNSGRDRVYSVIEADLA